MIKTNKIPMFHNPLRSESEHAYDAKMGKKPIRLAPQKVKNNADGEDHSNTDNMEEKSLAQSGAIFKKRLDLLNEYLVRESSPETAGNKPFTAFLAFKGVSPDEFLKDLPTELKSIPTEINELLHYSEVLHDYYTNLYVQYLRQEAGLSADGLMTYDQPLIYADGSGKKHCCKECAEKAANGYPNLEDDVKTYDTHHTVNADGVKVNCCGKCAAAANHNANGKDDPWVDQVEDNAEAVDAKAGFMNASGVTICPLPPIRPISPRGSGGLFGKFTKQIAANWATYDKNKAKFDACIKKKNTELYNLTHPKTSKDGGLSPALHVFNLTNPVLGLARAAYLGLLNMNVGGWATTWSRILADPDQTTWKKMYAIFYNVGGDENRLKDAINKGKNKKAIFKKKDKNYNAEPASTGVSAALTAAAGIIAALAGIMTAYLNNKGRTAAERAPGDAVDDSALRGDPTAPGGDADMPIDSGGSDGVPTDSMSTGMKWAIGLAIGVPLAVGAFFGIRYLVKN
ncbi:MAG TPA: hypothetical protein PK289_00035 [Bacteroidia bacterium]|nr:hypothetical protein [Bacteroidia bacterium]